LESENLGMLKELQGMRSEVVRVQQPMSMDRRLSRSSSSFVALVSKVELLEERLTRFEGTNGDVALQQNSIAEYSAMDSEHFQDVIHSISSLTYTVDIHDTSNETCVEVVVGKSRCEPGETTSDDVDCLCHCIPKRNYN